MCRGTFKIHKRTSGHADVFVHEASYCLEVQLKPTQLRTAHRGAERQGYEGLLVDHGASRLDQGEASGLRCQLMGGRASVRRVGSVTKVDRVHPLFLVLARLALMTATVLLAWPDLRIIYLIPAMTVISVGEGISVS